MPARRVKLSHFFLSVLSPEAQQEQALKRYQQVLAVVQEEFMVSGSDDFTMFLWSPAKEKKFLARLTGSSFTLFIFVPS